MGTTEAATRWNLKELIPDPFEQSLEGSLKDMERLISALESQKSELSPEIPLEKFSVILDLVQSLNTLISKVQAYASLWLTEDTQNETALNLRDRLDQSLVEIENRALFFDLWFKELPEPAAQRLIAASGDLKYFLESVRRFKPYTLSEAQESLINLKDVNGIDAIIGLYEMITNRFVFSFEVNGEKKNLTRDELSAYFFNASADIRLAAYKEFYRVYSENATVLAQIYSHRARDWHSEGVSLRGYASAISARNLGNDLPDAVVDTLLAVCRKNSGIFQRYFRLKAGWLGLDKLGRYDIYAPLAKADKEYSFAQAEKIVMDSFREFFPQIADLARRVFDERHLDALPRHRKRGGAFCSAVTPELTPWVMMNYSGRANDIPTLAHELGHAVHAMLAENHSVMTFHASLPLAETASVFAEMLVTGHLLREERDPAVKRDLMVRKIDDAYITVLRQAYFTLFEKDAHRMLVEGKSFEEVCSQYRSNLAEQFGDAVAVSDEFKWEWITVPHFYNAPFYTYAYSFGQLLVLSLYQKYQLEGEAFIPKYLYILSSGGSDAPASILQKADLDITSPDFWQGGFDILDSMIEELIKIS